MKKKSRTTYFILLGILILIISCNIVLILGADASLNFTGEWYSKGFSSVSLWKAFVNAFTSTLFKFKVTNDDGNIKLGLKDENGKEYVFDSYIKYNNKTGELYLQKNVTMFDGEVKNINYKVTLNGETDLRKILNVESYFGKTIGDIVKEVLSKKIKIGLVGERSNITLTANKNFTLSNPIIDVNYKKNIAENFTSPITEESDEEVVLNMANISFISLNGSSNISANNSINSSLTSTNGENTKESLDKEFKIINPKPSSDFSMFVNETKTFSIENSKNDSITWYLNGNLIKKDSQSYSFKALKKGFYNISVEVEPGLENQEHVWKVEVKSLEIPNKTGGMWVWIVAGLGFVIFWIVIIYYLKNQGRKKDTQTTLPLQKN
jgi:hypothetical protein